MLWALFVQLGGAMKNFFIGFLFVTMMVGCASNAPSQVYRGKSQKQAWEITGNYNELSKWLDIKIEGQSVISQRLPLFSSAGTATGTYNGRKVSADCSRVTKFLSGYTKCLVFIDNERAATLQF
jgi:hypothetical protein